MMKRLELLPGIVMFVVGLALALSKPAWLTPSSAQAYELRVLQVWPDYWAGVTSMLLEGSTTYTTTPTLPVGVHRHPAGDVVWARTYLHFPMNVFPAGTDVRRATLHMYIDSASGSGETEAGIYRVLEPWDKAPWMSDPATWPALLPSPISVAKVRCEVVTAPLTIPTPVITPTPLATPTAVLTPTPPLTPAYTISLSQAKGIWVSWDVTILMRAWLNGEIANLGLAIATAPDPAATPEEAGDLIVARLPISDAVATRPHIITEFDVLPVTPTPPPSPLGEAPRTLLPAAGGRSRLAGWIVTGIGVVLLILAHSRQPGRGRE